MASQSQTRARGVKSKPLPGGRPGPYQSRSGSAPPPAKPIANRKPAAPKTAATSGRTGGRTSQGTSGNRRVSTAAPAAIAGSQSKGKTPQILSGGKYQNIILAEFIGTLLLTVLTPVAKDDAKEGLSPYAGADMVKLASMVLLFFLLALVSSAGPGAARLAAWLGGLVLIADGLYEAANLSKDLSLFTGFLNRASNSGDTKS